MLLTIFDFKEVISYGLGSKNTARNNQNGTIQRRKKIYRFIVHTRRHCARIAFSFNICCVQLDFIFLGPFPTRDLQTFRNRARYFWRTACCLIPGISRIKFTMIKKFKILYLKKLFYKLVPVDGTENIYFEYIFFYKLRLPVF